MEPTRPISVIAGLKVDMDVNLDVAVALFATTALLNYSPSIGFVQVASPIFPPMNLYGVPIWTNLRICVIQKGHCG